MWFTLYHIIGPNVSKRIEYCKIFSIIIGQNLNRVPNLRPCNILGLISLVTIGGNYNLLSSFMYVSINLVYYSKMHIQAGMLAHT